MSTGNSNKRKATVLENQDNGFYIKHAPKKDMSGVDEPILKLCASVAGQIYGCKSDVVSPKDHFDLPEGAEVIHFENHGEPYCNVTPHMVVVVTGTTMILGWKGTATPSDALSDFHMLPVTSTRWSKISKQIKVHGGFFSAIENDLTNLEEFLVKTMEKQEPKITEIITTGHSLGGGLAQVAQLCIQAALLDKDSIWGKHKTNFEPSLTVRNVAFSAPASISTPSTVTDETKEFLNGIAAKSCNIVYGMDIVPRLIPPQRHFIDKAVNEILSKLPRSELIDALKLNGILKTVNMAVNVNQRILDAFNEQKTSETATCIQKVMRTFNHYGNILTYTDDSAEPVVYNDYVHDEASDHKKWSDMKWYSPYEKTDQFNNHFRHDHNQTVRGPGLSYSIKNETLLASKCYMMDECEIPRSYNEGLNIVGKVEFKGFDDCVKKAKAGMINSGYAAVAVWDKVHSGIGRAKFDHPGTLYIKSTIPCKSDSADARELGRVFNRSSKNKTTFWRDYALKDYVESKDYAHDIHPGVIELKLTDRKKDDKKKD